MDAAGIGAFVADPQHGLVKSRTVHGIRTTVTLMPPEVTALRERKGLAQDSCTPPVGLIIEQHRAMLCFRLNIALEEGRTGVGDVMYAGTRSAEEFKQQAFDLNFSWEQLIELRCGDKVYKPVLSSLENTYSLSMDRNVMLAFVPERRDDADFYGSEQLELVWRDDVFGTGVQHFRFDRAELKKVPQPSA